MSAKTMTKVLATSLAFVLSFANVALLGDYVNKTYAAGTNLEEQTTNVNKAKIEFDAYFQEAGQAVHSKTLNIDNEEENLYLSLKVEEGYFINGTVKIENANFKVQESKDNLNMIQSISSDENKIALNQISKDESVILKIPTKINAGSSFDVKDLSKIAEITLEGTYVNNKGKEIQVEKTIETETIIDGTTENTLDEDVTKYVTFNVNGNKGVILQTVVKSKLVDNKLPIKTTKLEIEIPMINNIKPKTIALSAKSLMSTNGISGKVFNEDEYVYENGKVTLEIQNNNEKLSWMKEVEDEIILTCIYEENAIINKTEIELIAKSQITYYGKELKETKQEVNKKIELKEQIGDIVTLDVAVSENTINKGYMLTEDGKNTSFVDTLGINIGYSELVDKIVFKDETNYVDKNGNIYPSSALYKFTKISKENLLEILGEDGYINIYSKDGNILSTLNKENLEYKFEEETDGITFETSKPISEGILQIENGREIKALEYSKEQEEMFTGYKINLAANVVKDNTVIIRGIKEKEIKLENPKTQAQIEISKPNISTVVENEGVELRVTLKTTDASTVLYKNPEIEIVLPKYITNVDIENVKLVYEKILKIENAQIYKNENGNIVIKITLSGEQKKYNEEAITEGATLVMEADITANELTPTRTEQAYLNVRNQNTEENITEQADVNFIAPAGIATINQISGYSDEEASTTSISGKAGVGEIKIKSPARQANVRMLAINNYAYDCDNVVIIGRTPFEGNKTISSGKELGSTFTAKAISGITSENGLTDEQMTVYYSSNGEATKDLANSSNGWTTNINEVDEVKSYMIELNDYKLKTGEILGFDYKVEIPENLERNQETYATFGTYYERASEEGENAISALDANSASQIESTPVGLTTGQGVNLSITLDANVENGANVEEFQGVIYTAKITNNNTTTAKNVMLTVEIPSKATLQSLSRDGNIIKDIKHENLKKIANIGDISAGQTVNVNFTLIMPEFIENNEDEEKMPDFSKMFENYTRDDFNSDADYEKFKQDVEKYKKTHSGDNSVPNRINIKAVVGVQGYPDEKESNSIINNIVPAKGRIDMQLTTPMQGALTKGKNMQYSLSVRKNITKELNNVVIKCKLPKGVTFKNTNQNGQYDSNTHTVTWNFEKMNSIYSLTVNTVIDELPENTYSYELEAVCTATCDESTETFESNVLKHFSYKIGAEISQTSNISSGKVSAEEQIIYTITVKNLAPNEIGVTVKDVLPEELNFVKYYYTRDGETTTVAINPGKTVNIPLKLKANETLTIHVQTIARTIREKSKEITNKVYVDMLDAGNIEGNSITHTLIGQPKGDNSDNNNSDPSNPNNPDNPNNTNTYTLSGTAWVDENKNGKRDDAEELLSGVKVYLLNSSTNAVVSTTTTNKTGIYTFSKVTNGNYIVAFEYDLTKYDLSTYKAQGVDESLNSDAINKELKINGKSRKYGVTDTIIINENKYNVDLGLISSPKFDLELTKGIDLIQVSNKAGTQSYKFNNSDSAQVQIASKNLKGSVVAITYTIKVKNTGAVAGYANKIVDYKAKDLAFSSTLNPEWYQDTNGNLYNTSLTGREIKPGETVEVSLVLTKTMTNENTGLSNNTAEIAESSNDLGLADIDSTPGNRNTSEDDFGSADAYITLKTGGILLYTGIVLAVLAIFAARSILNK